MCRPSPIIAFPVPYPSESLLFLDQTYRGRGSCSEFGVICRRSRVLRSRVFLLPVEPHLRCSPSLDSSSHCLVSEGILPARSAKVGLGPVDGYELPKPLASLPGIRKVSGVFYFAPHCRYGIRGYFCTELLPVDIGFPPV